MVLSPPFREIFRLPRLKFGHKFACTCEASEFTFRDEAGEGCAFPCAAARPLPCFLPFSLFPFRPSILGLFGVLLQTPTPEQKNRKTKGSRSVISLLESRLAVNICSNEIEEEK